MAADLPGAHWSYEIKLRIRRRYQQLSKEPAPPSEGARRMREAGYPHSVVERLPRELAAAYSGCGFPAVGLALDNVRLAVDLGCGAGVDAWWLAHSLPENAMLIALDMTLDMLQSLSGSCTGQASGAVICPVAADMERIPLALGIADLVIANASFNLTVDKRCAISEAFRILKPGGRLAARDLVREEELPAEVLEDPLADVTSLGGAVAEGVLREELCRAGFVEVRISDHSPFSYLTSVRVDALKPA
jgi:arsenite methyltransferase